MKPLTRLMLWLLLLFALLALLIAGCGAQLNKERPGVTWTWKAMSP